MTPSRGRFRVGLLATLGKLFLILMAKLLFGQRIP